MKITNYIKFEPIVNFNNISLYVGAGWNTTLPVRIILSGISRYDIKKKKDEDENLAK